MRLLSCPISLNIIDDSEFKIAGVFYILLLFSYLVSGYLFFAVFVLADIIMRLSSLRKSPILFFSSAFTKALKLKYSPNDEAPKIFALRLGSIMLLLIVFAHVSSFNVLAFMIALNLVVLKLLDVVLGYCVGCKLYSILNQKSWF